VSTEPRSEPFHRYERNPILTAAGRPSTVNAVFNPGVARRDGETCSWRGSSSALGFPISPPPGGADGLTNWRDRPGRPARGRPLPSGGEKQTERREQDVGGNEPANDLETHRSPSSSD